MNNFLEKILDFYFVRQIKSISDWMTKNGLDSKNMLSSLPYQERLIRGNFYNGVKVEEKASFVMCVANNFNEVLKKTKFLKDGEWLCIFKTNEIEVWESKDVEQEAVLPIRFGLSKSEKKLAINIARKSIENFLTTIALEINRETVPDRFLLTANVSVTLWLNGEQRGCRIVENLPLYKAIESASLRACRDVRFKPISLRDMKDVRVEIAVLSDLKMRLLSREISSDIIYSEKGYTMRVNNKIGWFIPAVFNQLSFKNLSELLKLMLEKKIGINYSLLHKSAVEIFEVDDFIESVENEYPLTLKGPVVVGLGNGKLFIDKEINNILHEFANNSVDFICKIQEEDGNIPAIINPLTHKIVAIDWVRLALTAWSVAYWAKITNNKNYKTIAKKSLLYISEYIYIHPQLDAKVRCLTLIYYRKLAVILEEEVEVKKSSKMIHEIYKSLEYDPILYSQLAIFMMEDSCDEKSYLNFAKELTEVVLEDYNDRVKNSSFISLASYPELIYLLLEIGNKLNDKAMVNKSYDIHNYYLSLQNNDGSFSNSPDSSFSYTRGTGKIFEVLCLNPTVNKVYINKMLCWFSYMQYTKENTYFIHDDIKGKIIGGFRHDYLNSEVWIDSSAHIIIGISRILENKESL